MLVPCIYFICNWGRGIASKALVGESQPGDFEKESGFIDKSDQIWANRRHRKSWPVEQIGAWEQIGAQAHSK